MVKSLVTSEIFHENAHVIYKNVEASPCITLRKIIGTKVFSSSGHISDVDDVIKITNKFQQKIRNQKIKLTHDEKLETNTFSVTDEARKNN